MADFTINMTGTAQLDDSIVQDYSAEFIAEYVQTNVMDQVAEWKQQIGAKSISMPRYAALTVDEAGLNEREDVDSEAMSDTEVLLTPAEYGKVVTLTSLASLQTGGRDGRAAVRQIAQNMSRARNVHATRAAEATTNVILVNSRAGVNDIVAGDVIEPADLNLIYNKLSRSNVPTHSMGMYVAVLHEDVIADLRSGSAAGSWEDVNKYNNQVPVLMNEVGMFKGFRIIRNNDNKATANTGAVKVYNNLFFGFNGLGLAESMVPEMRITGPFDKLGRFVNIGWYGVYKYGLVETSAIYNFKSASSFAV